jgi:hypothetical protein
MGEIIQLPVKTNHHQKKNESYLFQEEPPEEFLSRLWELLSNRPKVHTPRGGAGFREIGGDSV